MHIVFRSTCTMYKKMVQFLYMYSIFQSKWPFPSDLHRSTKFRMNFTDSHGFSQYVKGPTHSVGHTCTELEAGPAQKPARFQLCTCTSELIFSRQSTYYPFNFMILSRFWRLQFPAIIPIISDVHSSDIPLLNLMTTPNLCYLFCLINTPLLSFSNLFSWPTVPWASRVWADLESYSCLIANL